MSREEFSRDLPRRITFAIAGKPGLKSSEIRLIKVLSSEIR